MNFKLVYLIIVGLFMVSIISAKTTVNLQKALDKKYITAKAICKGGLELDYSISNLLKDSLIIILPAGWRFNSNAGKQDYQDILVAHEELLTLKYKETKTFNIRGFCCEATKSGPQKGAPYTIGKLADSNLVKLAKFLNVNQFDNNAEQYSVWAISDGKETAHITSANDSIASILRTFVAQLKHEPLPWYTLLKKAYVTNTGQVHDIAIGFKASVNYSIPQTFYSYCYIVDSNGQKVSGIFGQWLHPENTVYDAKFNIVGLKKGNYTLILEGKDKPLFQKSFKV